MAAKQRKNKPRNLSQMCYSLDFYAALSIIGFSLCETVQFDAKEALSSEALSSCSSVSTGTQIRFPNRAVEPFRTYLSVRQGRN